MPPKRRHIRLTFVATGESLFAELLDDETPATCDLVWDLLSVERDLFHGRWSGVKSRLFCSFLQTSQAPMSSSNSAGSTNQLISKYRFPESHSSLVSIHDAVTNRKQDSRLGKILTTRVLRLIS